MAHKYIAYYFTDKIGNLKTDNKEMSRTFAQLKIEIKHSDFNLPLKVFV